MFYEIRWLRAQFNLTLNVCRDGASTTSLDNLLLFSLCVRGLQHHFHLTDTKQRRDLQARGCTHLPPTFAPIMQDVIIVLDSAPTTGVPPHWVAF